MAHQTYGKRAPIPKRQAVEAGVFEAANIDTAGLDPEMKATLGQEAARRVGAAGVQMQTRNPFEGFVRGFKRIFRGR